MNANTGLTEKEVARSTLDVNKLVKTPIPTDKKGLIKLVKLYIKAEELIPLELHKMVNEACDAWTGTRPTEAYKNDAVYDLVYDIKLCSLLNKREGSEGPLEDALKSAKKTYGKENVRNIYKASSKNYKPRINLVKEAKADALEFYNSQNWDYTDEDIL